MLVRNLTSKAQELRIVEIDGGRGFTVYVEGNGTTELQGAFIADTAKIGKIFEIVGTESPIKKEEPIEEVLEEQIIESEETDEEDTVEEEITSSEDVPENFICDICGAEFASSRGLSSHMNRSHSENN